jgi:23S rRNA pseudouridine1911/1915/1917 synthase
LLHRLDYETQGLVLFAKNQNALHNLIELQNAGGFVKEYSAICQKAATDSSFPTPPFACSSMKDGFVIESFFRPYGTGRKQVRPVINTMAATGKKTLYRTEITGFSPIGSSTRYALTVRLHRGFRHQVRCHLAWVGWPVLHDPLYGTNEGGGFLALRANGLFFADPQSGEPKEYRIAPLEIP